ncbi:uncharacterized protein si:ch211-221j21.3 isoform X1 [Takifugu flavidus]|uniref:uncharacterized protein si:ch211-221j21.3 isoform X1 n=1 Tax=Takifugu flavidus TaxID=433684 RepID=UPI0025440554|nr:uncharacterized protein si:ch211-221j21.3 isoform X1 [Takifugu flavidus]
MQCLVRKRRPEPPLEPWSCSAKRVCTEAEVRAPECPMDTSQPSTGSSQQDQQQVMERTGRSGTCRRSMTSRLCLRAEPPCLCGFLEFTNWSVQPSPDLHFAVPDVLEENQVTLTTSLTSEETKAAKDVGICDLGRLADRVPLHYSASPSMLTFLIASYHELVCPLLANN